MSRMEWTVAAETAARVGTDNDTTDLALFLTNPEGQGFGATGTVEDLTALAHRILAALPAPTPAPVLTATVAPGDLGFGDASDLVATVEHVHSRVAVYEFQGNDDPAPVLVVDIDSTTDEDGDLPLRVYLNDAPLYRKEK